MVSEPPGARICWPFSGIAEEPSDGALLIGKHSTDDEALLLHLFPEKLHRSRSSDRRYHLCCIEVFDLIGEKAGRW
jgi:hypothetical protein